MQLNRIYSEFAHNARPDMKPVLKREYGPQSGYALDVLISFSLGRCLFEMFLYVFVKF